MTNPFLNHCLAPRVLSRGVRTGKFQRYLALLLFVAFAGSAVAGSARGLAQTETSALTYNDGDLFLGFRCSDRTNDYLINIGPPTQFVNAAPGSTFSVAVGSTIADLIATFGSDWNTRIDPNTAFPALSWGVTGGRLVEASGDPANTLYSTNPQSNPWPARSDTAQSFTTSLISALGNTFSGNQPSPNNPQGLVQSASSFNSYASFQPGGANSGGISFQTWNPWNDGASASTLFFNRIAPAGSCSSIVLGSFVLDGSGQLSFTANSSPTPVNITGTVTYCSNPSLPAVPNVTLTLTGAMSGSTVSDGAGNYTLPSLPSGGNYVVTPTKAAKTPGTSGINTSDSISIQRHFLGLGTPLSGCRQQAADTNDPPNGISTTDAIAAQRFFLGLTSGIAQTGRFKFTPASRSYQGLFCNRTAQNYNAVILGDAATAFVSPRPDGGPSPDAADENEVAATVAAVALPEVEVDQSVTDFLLQVTTTSIDAKNKLVGFQGDFTFDERVVTFQSEPVQKAGITRGNWNVSGNVLPGAGPIRTLRVSAFSNDVTALSGSGVLFELRIASMSAEGQGTQLLWAGPPDHFIFIDADLNTQRPGEAAPGSVNPAVDASKAASEVSDSKQGKSDFTQTSPAGR